ncbi:MAG: TonB family protein [Steroidobacteraceae bacterium]
MSTELLQTGLPPANDRMLTTCFLAAVFHGIVILGVTFSSSNRDAGGPDAPALEVVLVNDQAPLAKKNPHAKYVAQRTQVGSGNAANGEPTLIPKSSPAPMDRAGVQGGVGAASQATSVELGDEELVATHAPAVRILYFAGRTEAEEASQMPELLEQRPDLGLTPNDDGIELRMRGEPQNQLWVAADTRESDVAVYLDGWRRKIEHVGTMNFPDAARRRKLSGTPVIEVTIGADGRLLQSVVRRSSGHAEIDEAAMRILKLASPYDPFPAALFAKHDQIRIAYEWQFLGGAAQGGSVSYTEPGAAGGAP